MGIHVVGRAMFIGVRMLIHIILTMAMGMRKFVIILIIVIIHILLLMSTITCLDGVLVALSAGGFGGCASSLV